MVQTAPDLSAVVYRPSCDNPAEARLLAAIYDVPIVTEDGRNVTALLSNLGESGHARRSSRFGWGVPDWRRFDLPN